MPKDHAGESTARESKHGRHPATARNRPHPDRTSAPPGWPAPHAFLQLLGWFDGGVEHCQELLMRGWIEEEAPLIEDGFLGLAAGAFQHEFRKLLSSQSCGPIQDRLCR